MTRWATMTGSLVVIAGLGLAGTQLYRMGSERYQDLSQQQTQLSLQVSDLNDHFIALSRAAKAAPASAPASTALIASDQATQQLSLYWLSQTLQLAQKQLDQAPLLTSATDLTQPGNALTNIKNTLNEVKQALPGMQAAQSISSITAAEIGTAIDRDLKMIDDSGLKFIQSNQALDRQLATMQAQLDHMASQGPHFNPDRSNTASGSVDGGSFLNRFLVIERSSGDARSQTLQRSLICREVALTLGLVRQALAEGQTDRVMQLLTDSRTQLAGLVDTDARQMQTGLAALSVQETRLHLSALDALPPEVKNHPTLPAASVALPAQNPASGIAASGTAATSTTVPSHPGSAS